MINFAEILKVGFPKAFAAPVPGTDLVVTTDGVGTKILYEGITPQVLGYDLVAANVNDILAAGAEPIGFVNYIATGGQSPEWLSELAKGILVGCVHSGPKGKPMKVLGGETAVINEMDFEMAGFAIGRKSLSFRTPKEGDGIWALRALGPQTNGYTAIRHSGVRHEDFLKPSINYYRYLQQMELKDKDLGGLAHITGGGLDENLSRLLPASLRLCLDWELLEDMKPAWMEMEGLPESKDFNYGWGFCIISASTIPGATKIGEVGTHA